MWMIGESKKERKPVIFQNVQFSPKCSSQSVNPCLQSWTQWTNFFVEFWWKISHVHDLRGECTFLLYSSSSILPVKNLFHKFFYIIRRAVLKQICGQLLQIQLNLSNKLCLLHPHYYYTFNGAWRLQCICIFFQLVKIFCFPKMIRIFSYRILR